jgi:transposase
MAQLIAPDYGQQFLLPPALEDWVAKDHPVRFIREFVDQLDLAALGFAMPQSDEGRPAYAPGLLLKLWLYGYHHRLRSTRKLEAACREHISLVWLSGNIAPDHNTLWRFWKDNRKALRELFKQSVQLAVKAGLVGVVLQALDGTKLQAAASGQSGWRKEKMQKLLAALDCQLDEVEGQLEQEGPAEEGSGYRLPKSLQERQALREVVEAGLKQLEQDGRQHYHPKEPEARRMKCRDQGRPFAYNAQAVVDQSQGVVVAAEVTVEETDSNQLTGMVEMAQQNTGATSPVLTVADGGYGSGSQIARAAVRNMNVLVRPQEGGAIKDNGYSARDFKYDPVGETVTCPQNQTLDEGGQTRQKGHWIKRYRCHVTDCPAAPLCKDSKGRRVIEIWPHTAAVQAMRERLAQKQAQQQLSKRQEIIERHFGQIKQHEGFRRWTVGGLENVRTQWALINLVMNLRVLYRHWASRRGGPVPRKCRNQRGAGRSGPRRHFWFSILPAARVCCWFHSPTFRAREF